jgi:hypothetical protein
MGSVNAVTSMLGQLTSTGVSTSTSLVNNLTGTLSHTGSPTHTASTPEHTDAAPQSGPIGTAPLSGPTNTRYDRTGTAYSLTRRPRSRSLPDLAAMSSPLSFG